MEREHSERIRVNFRVLIVVCLGLWVCTLGIQMGSICGGGGKSIPWEQWKKGETDLFAVAAVRAKHKLYGIPFVLTYSMPVRPFSLWISCAMKEESGAKALFIENVTVAGKPYGHPSSGMSEYLFEERFMSSEHVGVSQRRVWFLVPGCVNGPESFPVTLAGRVLYETGEEKPFDLSMRVSLSHQFAVSTGWSAIFSAGG